MVDAIVAASVTSSISVTSSSEASQDCWAFEGSTLSSARVRGLEADLKALPTLDLYELRVRWRKLTRSSPPEHLSRSLLLRMIAYKLQARVHGDLDRESVRYLARVAKERARRLRAGEKRKPKQPPPIPPVPPRSGLKPGTLIGREFNGTIHRVTVIETGYVWNGHPYRSLSEIARRITGTRWNGPRFFGLRDSAFARGFDASGQGV